MYVEDYIHPFLAVAIVSSVLWIFESFFVILQLRDMWQTTQSRTKPKRIGVGKLYHLSPGATNASDPENTKTGVSKTPKNPQPTKNNDTKEGKLNNKGNNNTKVSEINEESTKKSTEHNINQDHQAVTTEKTRLKVNSAINDNNSKTDDSTPSIVLHVKEATETEKMPCGKKKKADKMHIDTTKNNAHSNTKHEHDECSVNINVGSDCKIDQEITTKMPDSCGTAIIHVKPKEDSQGLKEVLIKVSGIASSKDTNAENFSANNNSEQCEKSEGSDNSGTDGNTNSIDTGDSKIKEITGLDKAKLIVAVCIGLFEDFPAILLSFIILAQDACFLKSQMGLTTSANQISIGASIFNSFWSLLIGYMKTCKCCCSAEKGYRKQICIADLCPCCISEDSSRDLKRIICSSCCFLFAFPFLFISFVWVYSLIFMFVLIILGLLLLGYFTGKRKCSIADCKVKTIALFRCLANGTLFTVYMLNVMFGIVWFLLATTSFQSNQQSNMFDTRFQDNIFQDERGPGLDEKPDGSVFLYQKVSLYYMDLFTHFGTGPSPVHKCYDPVIYNRIYLGDMTSVFDNWPDKSSIVIPCEEAIPYFSEYAIMRQYFGSTNLNTFNCTFIAELQFTLDKTESVLQVSAGIQILTPDECLNIPINGSNGYDHDYYYQKEHKWGFAPYESQVEADFRHYQSKYVCNACNTQECSLPFFAFVSPVTYAYLYHQHFMAIHALDTKPECTLRIGASVLPLCSEQYLNISGSINIPKMPTGSNYTKYMFLPKSTRSSNCWCG